MKKASKAARNTQAAIDAALRMGSIFDTRDALQTEGLRLFEAVIAENDPVERKRLAYEMSEGIGAQLGHEMANGPAFIEAARKFVITG